MISNVSIPLLDASWLRTRTYITRRLEVDLAGGAICMQPRNVFRMDEYVLQSERDLCVKSLHHASYAPNKQVSCCSSQA